MIRHLNARVDGLSDKLKEAANWLIAVAWRDECVECYPLSLYVVLSSSFELVLGLGVRRGPCRGLVVH